MTVGASTLKKATISLRRSFLRKTTSGGVHPVKLEKMFRCIHANSANLFHGRSPLFEICNDLILAQSMPSGAVHPNTHCGNSN